MDSWTKPWKSYLTWGLERTINQTKFLNKIPNSNFLNNGESHAQEAFIDKLVHTERLP